MAFRGIFRSLVVASTLLSPNLVRAHTEDPRPSQYCAWSCYNAADELTFNTTSDAATDDYYTALCTNTLKITSIYYCAKAYCSDSEARSGLSLFKDICLWEASITPPSYESIVTADIDLASVPRASLEDIVDATVFDTPVIPDEEFFKAGYDTTHAYYSNMWLAHNFAYAFYGFWALVVLIGVASRIFNVLSHHNAKATSNSSFWLSIRRMLILPATFGRTCQEPIGWCTIPPRLETITLTIYVIMNIIFCFPGYIMTFNNLYWPENKEQLSRYISDRAGILTIANMPLIWLFATRNSPLLWATGWSFATFNRFHRWVARLATALAVAHGVGYTVYSFYTDYYTESWSDQYWYCGVMAVCCMTLIVGTSVYYLRRYHYELFLNIHIVLAVICTAALFYHVKIFNGMYNGFVWPCVAIWVFDRLLRAGRIIFNTVIPRTRSKVTAVATYNPESDTIRVDVTDFLRGKALSPGSFYYVYAPSAGMIRAYESHPFTLCSWHRDSPSVPVSPSSPTGSISFEKQIGTTIKPIPIDDSAGPHTSEEEEMHTFIIRPQSGMTRRLRNKIQSESESLSQPVPLLLEGPYGTPLDLSGFSDVLVIVGGVGVCEAVTLAYAGVASGARVRVAWAVKQSKLIDDVCANEFAALMENPRFELVAFVTGAEAQAGEGEVKSSLGRCEVRAARPDVEVEMRAARTAAARNLAVVSCGPGFMADQCRRTAVRLMGEKGAPMDYFNHTMGW